MLRDDDVVATCDVQLVDLAVAIPNTDSGHVGVVGLLVYKHHLQRTHGVLFAELDEFGGEGESRKDASLEQDHVFDQGKLVKWPLNALILVDLPVTSEGKSLQRRQEARISLVFFFEGDDKVEQLHGSDKVFQVDHLGENVCKGYLPQVEARSGVGVSLNGQSSKSGGDMAQQRVAHEAGLRNVQVDALNAFENAGECRSEE